MCVSLCFICFYTSKQLSCVMAGTGVRGGNCACSWHMCAAERT